MLRQVHERRNHVREEHRQDHDQHDAAQPVDRPDPAPTAATMSRSRSIARL